MKRLVRRKKYAHKVKRLKHLFGQWGILKGEKLHLYVRKHNYCKITVDNGWEKKDRAERSLKRNKEYLQPQ